MMAPNDYADPLRRTAATARIIRSLRAQEDLHAINLGIQEIAKILVKRWSA